MPVNAAMFLFLAAAVVSVFAFCSIVVGISAPAQERQNRDRLALLKTLADHTGENAKQVLEMLREEQVRRLEKSQREERRGWIVGGLVLISVGVSLGVMLALIAGEAGVWSVGLIPFLIGCVLFGAGLRMDGPGAKSRPQ